MYQQSTETSEYGYEQKLYEDKFSLGFLGPDISNKFALISLVCHLTQVLKAKNPDITYWTVLYKLSDGTVPENFLRRLSIICSDFSYGCTKFPTFDLKDKDIPSKIKELLKLHVPF